MMASVKLLLLLSLGAFAAAAPTVHVFLIIGQSNSIGYNSDGHTDEDVAPPNTWQASPCVNGGTDDNNVKLIVAQDPLHHYCDDGYLTSQNVGFGVSFARELRTAIPEDDIIVLVPAGIGGTGFVDNVWTAYTGSGFVQALNRLRSTFKAISAQFQVDARLTGILWHQGEADADVDTSTGDYLNLDIIPMINAWRNSSLIPQSSLAVPFVVGNLVPTWEEDPTQTKRLGVLVALQLLDQYVPFTASVPSRGLVGDQSEAPNPIHFSAKSQRLLGKRYALGYSAATFNRAV